MKRKNIAMTGGAAFAAAALFAAPAMAQTTPSTSPSSPTQYSEPMSSQNSATPADQNSATPADQSSTSSMTDQNGASTVALSSVSNAKQTLASASVQDAAGQTIGQVQKVKTNASGTPTAIEVNLTSANTPKTVQLKANQLRYDQSSNMLQTISLTSTQIDAMPAITSP